MAKSYNGWRLIGKAYGQGGNVTLARTVGNNAIIVYHTGASINTATPGKGWVVTARQVYNLLVKQLIAGRAVALYVFNSYAGNQLIVILPTKDKGKPNYRVRLTNVCYGNQLQQPGSLLDSVPSQYGNSARYSKARAACVAARLALGWAIA